MLIIGVVIGLGATIALGMLFRQHRAELASRQLELAVERSRQISTSIGLEVQKVADTSKMLAEEINSGELGIDQMEDRFQAELASNQFLFGVGAFFDAVDKTEDLDYIRRQHMYFVRKNGEVNRSVIRYDYGDMNLHISRRWYGHGTGNADDYAGDHGSGEPARIWAGGQQWNVPYFGATNRTMNIQFLSALALPEMKRELPGAIKDTDASGMMLVSFALDNATSSLNWLGLGSSGYAFMVTHDGDGQFVTHPVDKYWTDPSENSLRTVYSDHIGAAVLDGVASKDDLCSGPEYCFEFRDDDITNQDTWLIFNEVTANQSVGEDDISSSWLLGSVVVKSAVMSGDIKGRQLLHFTITLAVITALLAGAVLIRFVSNGTSTLWGLSLWTGLIATFGIALIWAVAISFPSTSTELVDPSISFVDGAKDGEQPSTLDSLISTYASELKKVEPDARMYAVSTGIHIDSLEIDDANKAMITGTVWQKYKGEGDHGFSDLVVEIEPDNSESTGLVVVGLDDTAPEQESQFKPGTIMAYPYTRDPRESLLQIEILPGFIFPDEIEATSFEKLYDVVVGATRTVGWRFSTTVRAPSNFSKYPFDQQTLSLRLRHKQIEYPIVMVPDIGEYRTIIPENKPGMDDSVGHSGFSTETSYFNYGVRNFDTSFGIPRFTGVVPAPELQFNIGLTRKFLDPFLSRMLPLTVVTLLVFAILFTATRVEARQVWFGTTAATGLAALGSLMFVSVVGHNSLRNSLETSEIIYLEFFYFVLFAAIVVVAINIIAFKAGTGGNILQYRDNLIPKLLYWPIVTTTIFVITWIRFF